MALLRPCARAAGLVAILVGLLLSGTITRLGLFRWIASRNPYLVGHSPPFTLERERWHYDYDQLERVSLSGQTALVTGANSGLGFVTALRLAQQGAHVLLACRNAAKCAEAVVRIRTSASSKTVVLSTLSLDTSSLASVRAAADAFEREHTTLDMLVLNAGVLASSELTTADGIEAVFQTNHVGQHLLTARLLPSLRTAAELRGTARIVLVSSHSHYDAPPFGVALSREALTRAREQFSALNVYGMSKLAQVLEAQEMARRLGPGARVLVNVCHPGGVDTGIFSQLHLLLSRHRSVAGDMLEAVFDALVRQVFWSAELGALTQLWLAASVEVREGLVTGRYFHPQCLEQSPCATHATNATLQRAVWHLSNELAGLPSDWLVEQSPK